MASRLALQWGLQWFNAFRLTVGSTMVQRIPPYSGVYDVLTHSALQWGLQWFNAFRLTVGSTMVQRIPPYSEVYNGSTHSALTSSPVGLFPIYGQ